MKKYFPLLFLGILILAACGKKNKYPTVSTFAGSGAMGSANGTGTQASFSNMMGIATDDHGNVYVADSHNNLIRRISEDGTVATLAGNGQAGSVDGKGDTASFFYPTALTVDKHGNVYVADTHNNLIRKIDTNGFVTTFAGQRVYLSIPGTDTIIRFDNPDGIVVDTAGNVYVADWGNDRIRKINPDGKVTGLAGNGTRGSKDGPGKSASFYLPGGLAIDSGGNVYVADTYNNLIRKIRPDGFVTTIAGKTGVDSADRKIAAATFSHPVGIAVGREGNIYVADMGNNKIRKITPEAVVITFAGSGARGARDGRDTTAAFNRPYGVAIDIWGNLFVADYQNNLIRKISF